MPRTSLAERPIPAVSAGPITEDHVPVLLWVHSGTATVEAAGSTYRLRSGQAIWIPPGVVHCTRTDEGGVVLPIFPSAAEPQGPLAEVRVIAIPEGWEDWLVLQFDFNQHHSLGARTDTSALLALVSDGPARHEKGPGRTGTPALPLPYSPAGRAVAQSLLRAPSDTSHAEEFAARENVSVRTLQRQFRKETGLAFAQWRARARATVAAHHLAAGRDSGWTGRVVGYETAAGFTRGFRRQFGVSPGEYARRVGSSGGAPASTVDIGSSQRGPGIEGREPPPIPSRQVWDWVFDWHVLWWAYRGTVDVRIGSHRFTMRRGEAVWLPAGVSASVDLAEGSILLPLGNRDGGMPVSVDQLSTFTLPESAEAFLLHTVLTEYTLFAPEGPRARLADELFREQFAVRPVGDTGDVLSGAVATIARALRGDPADSRSLAAWAAHLGLPARRIGEEFRSQTGSSFPHWRAQLRMSLARELLMLGQSPLDVSRRLGYATPAAFSKVFRDAHGLSPRGYQRHVSLSDRQGSTRAAVGSAARPA